jgi:glutamyl-tRNA reductase
VQLILVHQSSGAAPLPDNAPIWRTCLRDVAFLSEDTPAADALPVIAGADAYALLLEIVSGLRSPLVGETEVQAQFKTFLASLDREKDAGIRRVGQRVLGDAKLIRQRHLQGFGAHSYGGLVARRIAADRKVVLAGTGALAAEILQHLRHVAAIDQWGRRPPRQPADAGQSVTFYRLSGPPPAPSAQPVTVVIAAPLSDADLAAMLRGYPHVAHTIDLRATHERTNGRVPGAVLTTLDDLFAEARADRASSAGRIAAARQDAQRCAESYAQREELRPFGWDDLCA